jgi:hypothetical protein
MFIIALQLYFVYEGLRKFQCCFSVSFHPSNTRSRGCRSNESSQKISCLMDYLILKTKLFPYLAVLYRLSDRFFYSKIRKKLNLIEFLKASSATLKFLI